ncbi:hypothetical protein RKLH11_1020 [Rhodobacteraceae bacterium KLH11]|nr:hypothetical protein RKLH11_1020 [Rhodobacteraceae bacterium KLH11]
MSVIQTLKHQKWLTLVVLALLFASTLAGLMGVWGLLFVFWAVLAIRSGRAFLIEPLDRSEHPILFWLLTVLWISLGLLYILADFFPHLMNG